MPGVVKSVFITGAGSGMGREGAKLFHAKGWRVGAVDRNADGLAALRQELGAERLWTRAVDVTDKAALDGALADFCAGQCRRRAGHDVEQRRHRRIRLVRGRAVRSRHARRRGELQSGADRRLRRTALPQEDSRQSDVLDVVVVGHVRACRASPSTRRPSMRSKG